MTNMRIGIDISQIIYGTGVSLYTEELIKHFETGSDKYVLFGGSLRRKGELESFAEKLAGKYEKKFVYLSPTFLDFLWNRLHVFEVERLIGKVDVFHASDWTQPPTKAFRVSTVHDLAAIKFPEETPKRIVEVHKRRLYWVVKEVNRIIVPTRAMKDELVELGARKEKIRVIYEAAGEKFKRMDMVEVEEVKRKFQIRHDYIMAVGIGKRKNTTRIIEAYEKLKTKNLKLVIVGGNNKTNFETRGVIYTGYVSDLELVALYSGARALVYASLYEGFGLPILQAMSIGCPVVTSNVGSMREVAGEAGVLVDPMDTGSIGEGIRKAIDSPKTLGRLGPKRAGEFSWEKTAWDTLEVYKESQSDLG